MGGRGKQTSESNKVSFSERVPGEQGYTPSLKKKERKKKRKKGRKKERKEANKQIKDRIPF